MALFSLIAGGKKRTTKRTKKRINRKTKKRTTKRTNRKTKKRTNRKTNRKTKKISKHAEIVLFKKRLCNEASNNLLQASKKKRTDLIKFFKSLEIKNKFILTSNWEETLFKTTKSLSNKIYSDLNRSIKGKNLSKKGMVKKVKYIQDNINDYTRVTYVSKDKDYVKGVLEIIDNVRSYDCFQLKPCKKHSRWEKGDNYQGINTVWDCPKYKTRIEIQFHTNDSLNVKEKELHPMYDDYKKKCIKKNGNIIKNKACNSINSKMLNIEDHIPIPNGLIIENVYIRYDKNGKAYFSNI